LSELGSETTHCKNFGELSRKLEDAARITGLFITPEALIAEVQKKDASAMSSGGGMGGVDY
jgi:hypothetical protein